MECAARGLAAEPCAGGVADRRCGGCGAVSYCSRAHQIIHWSVHKEECERFAEQMRHINLLSQFPFTFLEPPALIHGFPSARCFLLQSIKLHQRGLWKSECICGPDVASAEDLKSSQQILQSLMLFLLLYSIAAEWNLQSSLCPCTEPENPVRSVLESWEDYYQWRSLPMHSPVAVILHWPLTLYHCLQLSRLQTPRCDGEDTLCIHYLGALFHLLCCVLMRMCTTDFCHLDAPLATLMSKGPEKELLQLAAFGELRALFPGIQIHIELVGPEVPKSRDGEIVNISRYARCSDESCCCKSSIDSEDLSCTAVTLKLWNGLYHERCSDIMKVSNPHLIVAPNAGVAAYPSWMPTIVSVLFLIIDLMFFSRTQQPPILEIIRHTGIPAIFTDFCEEAAHLASCCISSITGQPLKIPERTLS
ncbi:hypothetical protein U9M48_015217 [Paspalum notatum var. saurae]|uniref:MYND-type domain-containing protein n=1 Tax=Paspalum notatum var. saurae TaxID=547442 RepID=A0AAQ3WLQ7_PASNO